MANDPSIRAAPDFNPLKIFVGGVSHSVDEDAFRGYFAQFGEVVEGWLMYDPQTSRPRGFGFIVYRDSAVHEEVLKGQHQIAGKYVELKRATPRSANPPPNRGNPMGVRGGRFGPGGRNYVVERGGGMGGGGMGGGMGGGGGLMGGMCGNGMGGGMGGCGDSMGGMMGMGAMPGMMGGMMGGMGGDGGGMGAMGG